LSGEYDRAESVGMEKVRDAKKGGERRRTEKQRGRSIPKPTIPMPFDLFENDPMSARTCLRKKVRTHTTKAQLHQNAQTGKHAAGKGAPCFSGRVEYTVYDRHKGDEVEGDGGCNGGTDEAETEGSGTPYCFGGGRDGHVRGGGNIPRR